MCDTCLYLMGHTIVFSFHECMQVGMLGACSCSQMAAGLSKLIGCQLNLTCLCTNVVHRSLQCSLIPGPVPTQHLHCLPIIWNASCVSEPSESPALLSLSLSHFSVTTWRPVGLQCRTCKCSRSCLKTQCVDCLSGSPGLAE